MGSGSFCAWGKSGEDRPFLGVWTKAGTILTFFHYGSTLFRKGRNFISTNLIYAHAMPENCSLFKKTGTFIAYFRNRPTTEEGKCLLLKKTIRSGD